MTTAIAKQQGIRTVRTERSRLGEVDFAQLPFGKVFSDHMFVVDCIDGQWVDPRIEPYGPISFGPAMSALNYGQTIFEGLKAYRRTSGDVYVFRPLDHLKRLNRSGERLCMAPVPEDIYMQGLLQLVDLDRDWVPAGGSLYIRPLYFATDELLGVKDSSSYRLVIFTSPVHLYYSAPLRVFVTTNYVRATDGGIGSVKTAGNYARSLKAAREAREHGFNVVLWLDANHRQFIEEYSTMNAFFVIDDIVVTPQLCGTILEGITRDTCITLLRDNGFKVQEREVSINEVMGAGKAGRLAEAFGTGTAAMAAPVEMLEYYSEQIQMPATDGWKAFNFLTQMVTDIRLGNVPDEYGWCTRV